MRKIAVILRNLSDCSRWKVSQNLALANSTLKHVPSLKCVLKLVKPPPANRDDFPLCWESHLLKKQ